MGRKENYRSGSLSPPGREEQPQRGSDGYDRPLPGWLARLLTCFPYLQRHPHPFLAHFPIVFLWSATFFSLLYLLSGNRSFEDTAFCCLGAGVLFLPPTIATGLFTSWLNFPGEDKTLNLEKRLSYALLLVAGVAFLWRWLNPRVLVELGGVNYLYLLLIVAVTPLVTITSYFGGMLTYPLAEGDPSQPASPPVKTP